VQPDTHIHSALLDQFERLLGRRPGSSEPVQQLAMQLKERIDVLQSAGTLPQQQDLLNTLGQQLAMSVTGGDAAAPVISALLNQLQAAAANQSSGGVTPPANAVPQVVIPAGLAKVVSPLPQRLQWLAMLVAPLVLGGVTAVPLWQTFFSTPGVKLERATADANDRAKKEIDQARKETEQAKAAHKKASDQNPDLQATINDLNKTKDATTKENSAELKVLNDRVQALGKEASRSKMDLQRASNQVKDLQQVNLELSNNKIAMTRDQAARTQSMQDQITQLEKALSSSRTPGRSGFVVWKGTGKKVNFRPNPDHGSLPDQGSLVEGNFPAGDCRVEEVFGEHVVAKSARNSACGNFSFDVKKSSETTAYILWRIP
jgi:hypothetical protein